MGAYSSVWIDCPTCGQPIEFQVKGENRFDQYFAKSYIPLEVMLKLEKKTVTCEHCGKLSQARIHYKPELVLERK